MSLLRKRSAAPVDRNVHQSNAKLKSEAPSGSRSIYSIAAALFFGVCVLYATSLSYPAASPTSQDAYAICSRGSPRIYTVDEKNSLVQCLVVEDSWIADTGSIQDVTQRWTEAHASVNLPIRYIGDASIIVPGLSDSHAHILEYGGSRILPLEGGKSIADTVALVREFILAHPHIRDDKSVYVEGWGWDHTSWPTEEWPTMESLEVDPVVRGRPIVLQSKDGHALWLSAKAMASCSHVPETVEGGIIVRSIEGAPTGVLLDNAQVLIARPQPTEQALITAFTITVRDALSRGLTSIHDAGFKPISLAFFRRQAESGNLPIRIYGMTYFDEGEDYWGNITQPIIGAGNGRLNARSVKIFADGALRSGGAALYEPYSDNPATDGFMRLDKAALTRILPSFLRDGWQVNVHAIGDRANGIVLDVFEETLPYVNVTALRPRLEHAQLLTQKDMARVGKLGVIASVQPTHAISDMWYAEDRLGPERVKGLYAFRSLINHGARLTLGSDFPVEDMNPLAGFYAAITRLSPEGYSPHGPSGWFPEQRLTREEALRGITIDAAYASFTEDTLGSLVPGKRADYVVLSQDIMAIPVEQILSTEVQATVIDGHAAFGHI